MNDEASPRPWQVRYGDTVADANGAKVAACSRPENAALIVDAVNEYARRENWRKKYIDRRVNDAARIEGLYADISDLEVERDRLNEDIESWRRGYIKARTERNAYLLERDRLRDVMRNAVETLEQVYKHADMTDALREVVVETQREARAAIEEAAP